MKLTFKQYILILGLFLLIIDGLASSMFKNRIEGLGFFCATTIGFCGPIIEAYYSDRIAKYLNLNTNIPKYINWHSLATSKMTYEESAIQILSFSTLGIGMFIFAFILGKQELTYSLEVSLILILPFLGIGLRWTCFNDKSKMDGDIQVISTYKSTRIIESGYNPYSHTFCACFVCYLGYYSLLHIENLLNFAMAFMLTTIFYLVIIFPDKANKILPFNNRTVKGRYVYLGIIVALFVILMKGFIPPEIMELIRHAE